MVKSLNRKEKRKQGSLKKKKSTKSKYQLSDFELSAIPTTLRIIQESKEQLNEMMKSTDRPLLKRLFRKENIDKLDSMPTDLTDISKYTSILKKELVELKQNKKYQPNQDFYDYVNYQWIDEQTTKLKEIPKYYVEVDDFRIVQDNVYREIMDYTKTYVKENPQSKKAKSINAVAHCVQKASKKKGLEHCQEILKEITHFIEDENMYGLLAYTNQDEIFSWQSPIVWSVMPDEKNVKKYISHLSPPQLGIYDYFI